MLATSYPMLDVFVSTLYFVLFIFWIILVFHIMLDIFRSHDLGGVGKTLWILVMLVLPLIGSLVYVLVRGGGLHARSVSTSQMDRKDFEDYIRQVANTKE
ncbi:MAG: PLDc N-terminal domain-containing protein [Acidimicrobiales bacterium]